MGIAIKTIYRFYDYFYNKKYGTNFLLSKTDKNDSVCQTFLELLEGQYGVCSHNTLFNYFIFQFDYWETVKINKAYGGQIQLAYIIGKKAFNRYKNRDQSFDWKFSKLSIIQKYGLSEQDLIEKPVKVKHRVKSGVDTEAAIKLASYNTEEGYELCGDYSTLYHHKSSICLGCNYQQKCKERLKGMYPGIYKDRGYK